MQPHTILWDTKCWRYFVFVQFGFGPEFFGWLVFQKRPSHLMYEIHIWIWWLPECSKNLFVPIAVSSWMMMLSRCVQILALIFFFFPILWPGLLTKWLQSQTIHWKCKNFIYKDCLTGPRNRLSNKFIGTEITSLLDYLCCPLPPCISCYLWSSFPLTKSLFKPSH